MTSVDYLSDGIMSLALIKYQSDAGAGKVTSSKNECKEFVRLHHLGFWVDDVEQTKKAPEKNGGQYLMGNFTQNTGSISGF